MKWIAIITAALVLSACARSSYEARQAFEAECRLSGFESGTQQFADCMTVKMHKYEMARAEMRYRASTHMGNAMQGIGFNMMNFATTPPQRVAPARIPYYGAVPSQ